MTTQWVTSMLGWNKSQTPFEKLCEHWQIIEESWNSVFVPHGSLLWQTSDFESFTRTLLLELSSDLSHPNAWEQPPFASCCCKSILESNHLIAFVTILCEQVLNTNGDLNPCSEFFFENRIFETMVMFASKSQTLRDLSYNLQTNLLIASLPPIWLMARPIPILDIGLSDKIELLKLIITIIRKIQSFPQVASLFVVEYTISPTEKSMQYQLINLLSILYSIPRFKEESTKLIASLLAVTTDSSVDPVTGDTLCHAIVEDLVETHKNLPEKLTSHALGTSNLIRQLQFCNTITKGPTFATIKSSILSAIHNDFFFTIILAKLQDSNLEVVNANIVYLTEIVESLSKLSSPLHDQVLNFIFSEKFTLSTLKNPEEIYLIDYLTLLLETHSDKRAGVNILRLLSVLLELRGSFGQVTNFVYRNFAGKSIDSSSSFVTCYMQFHSERLPDLQPSLLLDLLIKFMQRFVENSFEFNLYCSEVVSLFMLFPDPKLFHFWIQEGDGQQLTMYAVLVKLREEIEIYKQKQIQSVGNKRKSDETQQEQKLQQQGQEVQSEPKPEKSPKRDRRISLEEILTRSSEKPTHQFSAPPPTKPPVEPAISALPNLEEVRKNLTDMASPANNFGIRSYIQKENEYQWNVALLSEVLKEVAASIQAVNDVVKPTID